MSMFIGGPLDGQRRCVMEDVYRTAVPAEQPVAWDDGPSPETLLMNVGMVEYTKRSMRFECGATVVFYAPVGTPTLRAVQQVFTAYLNPESLTSRDVHIVRWADRDDTRSGVHAAFEDRDEALRAANRGNTACTSTVFHVETWPVKMRDNR